eukprot:7268200-Karenia_brevis.AAC.1
MFPSNPHMGQMTEFFTQFANVAGMGGIAKAKPKAKSGSGKRCTSNKHHTSRRKWMYMAMDDLDTLLES